MCTEQISSWKDAHMSIHQRNANLSIMGQHFLPVRMTVIRYRQWQVLVRLWRNWSLHKLLWGLGEKMAEWKDVGSSSPARTPKLQPTAEQPSTGECWIPRKKDNPHPREKEKPQQDSWRGEITFRIKSQTHQRCSEGSNKTLCTTGPRGPTETEPELYLSVCCGVMGQQWPTAGAGVQET